MKKTSSFQNSLIWFGAAVSIAEILTGTYFAPLGFTKGLLAILVGPVIGCAMLFFAGRIGGSSSRSCCAWWYSAAARPSRCRTTV